MNVLILHGSPHENGTTACLGHAFEEGAKEAGHNVTYVDVAQMDIHPCRACYGCRAGGADTARPTSGGEEDKGCVIQDDMQKIYPLVINADVIVYAFPVFNFGMPSQLKMCIDRWYAMKLGLAKKEKTVYLLSACGRGDNEIWATEGIFGQIKGQCRWKGWTLHEPLVARGCYFPKDLEKTDYLQRAKEMGRTVSK